MAELLQPLQSVLAVIGNEEQLARLKEYADSLDADDQQRKSPGIQLLQACREILPHYPTFILTETLVGLLNTRLEEPWSTFNRGNPITALNVSQLLRPYGIKPTKHPGKGSTQRGYFSEDFADVFKRYLTPPVEPGNPETPVTPPTLKKAPILPKTPLIKSIVERRAGI
jgi:hypothetical protein